MPRRSSGRRSSTSPSCTARTTGRRSQGHDIRLAVQLALDRFLPQWPDPGRPQQLHLDIEVDDVDHAERQVLALGARRLPDPPDAEVSRLYADPAEHPCCLVPHT